MATENCCWFCCKRGVPLQLSRGKESANELKVTRFCLQKKMLLAGAEHLKHFITAYNIGISRKKNQNISLKYRNCKLPGNFWTSFLNELPERASWTSFSSFSWQCLFQFYFPGSSHHGQVTIFETNSALCSKRWHSRLRPILYQLQN